MAMCLVALAIGLAMSERARLEIEFFYKSRVAQELSATHLQVEATPGLRMFVQPGDAVLIIVADFVPGGYDGTIMIGYRDGDYDKLSG